jgi:hypothetical protein
MYKLYTDKVENFKCSIDLEGASLDDTKVRLVLESGKLNLLYEGEVDAEGNCTIPIDKLKNVLKEGTEGTMKLEVIAEDTFFSPWEDQFSVNASKRVTVEVLNNDQKTIKESKVKVKVDYKKAEEVETTPEVIKEETPVVEKKTNLLEKHSTVVTKLLEKKGISKKNISENIDSVSKIIFNYSKKYKVENSNDLLLSVFDNIN